jgi:23S rRNA (adenine2503-C2)-methyltransferase
MVNLIRYNATGILKPSKEASIKVFKDLLQTAGIETTRRFSFGEDIEAACGQLAAKPS